MKQKKLEILIGDDLFMDPVSSIQVEKCLNAIPERLAGNYTVAITQAAHPTKMMREGQRGIYDIIVSDLDYGTTGRVGTEGFQIVDHIAAMQLSKKPYVIMCTSSDNQGEEIQRRIDAKIINAYVGDGAHHKFQTSVEHIAQKYGGDEK